jgi:hypothetical protein
MPNITMEQIAKVSNFATSRGLDPREVIEALQAALDVGIALGVPVDETEELFFLVGKSFDA